MPDSNVVASPEAAPGKASDQTDMATYVAMDSTATEVPRIVPGAQESPQTVLEESDDSDNEADPYGHLTNLELKEIAEQTGRPELLDRRKKVLDRGLKKFLDGRPSCLSKTRSVRHCSTADSGNPVLITFSHSAYYSVSPETAMRYLDNLSYDSSGDEEDVLEPGKKAEGQKSVEETSLNIEYTINTIKKE